MVFGRCSRSKPSLAPRAVAGSTVACQRAMTSLAMRADGLQFTAVTRTDRYGSNLPLKRSIGLATEPPPFLQTYRAPVFKRVKQRSGSDNVGKSRECQFFQALSQGQSLHIHSTFSGRATIPVDRDGGLGKEITVTASGRLRGLEASCKVSRHHYPWRQEVSSGNSRNIRCQGLHHSGAQTQRFQAVEMAARREVCRECFLVPEFKKLVHYGLSGPTGSRVGLRSPTALECFAATVA